MARPWRRVLINLSIRIGVSLQELEDLDVATIRHYLAALRELNKPRDPGPSASLMRQQTPEEMMAAIGSALRKG